MGSARKIGGVRTIGVVTVGRSDYGIYRPILRRIQKDSELKLQLFVAGIHLLEKFGKTVGEIRKDGFPISETVAFPFASDSPEGIAETMGAAVQAFAKSFSKNRPDLLLVLGDRFEMHAAALAALPFKIPVAHIHGGELTLGAIDNSLRHSLTMLSHLHFPACEIYAKRILQMGEEPWRVTVSGAPALEELQSQKKLSLKELAAHFDLPLEKPPMVVTFHPVTLEFEETARQMDQLLAALESFDGPIVFTGTNADTQNSIIWKKIRGFISNHPKARLVVNFGPDYYFSLLANARLMVGNSSSGLVEAPSFGLPVVNIGNRQGGRVRAANVIDCGYETEKIMAAIRQAISPEFRRSLKGLKNPYGDGHASEKILKVLKEIPLDARLVVKKFNG